MNEQRFRKWHIVIQDENTTYEDIYSNINSHKQTHYCIIGKEKAPTTGKIHFHVYVEFDNACTFMSLKKIFPLAHIEDAHGTASQNKGYITKEDKDYKEFGIPTTIKYNNDDIALNIIDYMNNNPFVELYNVALDCPEFCDYIVKNYYNLTKIQHDICEAHQNLEDKKKQLQNPGYEIPQPEDLTF